MQLQKRKSGARLLPAPDPVLGAGTTRKLEIPAPFGAASQAVVSAFTRAVKEAVNRAYETTLHEGLLFERRTFHAMFATEDQKEGMAAFLEKREAQFRDK